MSPQTEQRDWVPAVAIAAGAVGLAAGIYFYTKKPRGVDPGDVVVAHFKFDYNGTGGAYVLQVSFGRLLIGEFFDHIEGMTWETTVALPEPSTYEFNLECPLPQAAETRTYDAEALIRTPMMGRFDYLVKALTKSAIAVRKA